MYRLAKDTDITYQTLWKLKTGQSQRIGFDILEKICVRLNCTPGDLLAVIPGKPTKKATKAGKRQAK